MPHSVFVSYASTDTQWVGELVKNLELLGHEAWLDEKNINPGDSLFDVINEGLDKSEIMILVCSKASMQSKWVHSEVTAMFSDFITNDKKARIIPIILEECILPPLLRGIRRIEFIGIEPQSPEFKIKVQELARSLNFPESRRRGESCIPLVVVSMTAKEVEELFDLRVFAGDPSKQALFEEFVGVLTPLLGLEGRESRALLRSYLLPHYGQRREEWRPLGLTRSILDVVKNRFDKYNTCTDSVPTITAELWNDYFFSADDDLRAKASEYLGRSGCYILIDPLALFHPQVVKILIDAQISNQEAVTILCTSPLNLHLLTVSQMMEKVFRNRLGVLFQRFQGIDLQCVLSVEDPFKLDLWLKAQIPIAVDRLNMGVPSKWKIQVVQESVTKKTDVARLVIPDPTGR